MIALLDCEDCGYYGGVAIFNEDDEVCCAKCGSENVTKQIC